jgi:hypothetical protein
MLAVKSVVVIGDPSIQRGPASSMFATETANASDCTRVLRPEGDLL